MMIGVAKIASRHRYLRSESSPRSGFGRGIASTSARSFAASASQRVPLKKPGYTPPWSLSALDFDSVQGQGVIAAEGRFVGPGEQHLGHHLGTGWHFDLDIAGPTRLDADSSSNDPGALGESELGGVEGLRAPRPGDRCDGQR